MSTTTMLSPSTPICTLPRVTATARPYHHGNVRPALLAAAERALADGRELSLRELAREIGVSHAAPRRHFAGKQALLDALALDGFERLEREMAAAAVPDGDFREGMRAIARTYVRFATEHAALLDLMYAGKHQPGADALREAADRAFAIPLALFAQAQERGEIAAEDGLRAGLVTWSAFHGVAAMANSGLTGDEPLEPLVDLAVDQLLDGLRPR
jgi:AcrR family transcriptional regulator